MWGCLFLLLHSRFCNIGSVRGLGFLCIVQKKKKASVQLLHVLSVDYLVKLLCITLYHWLLLVKSHPEGKKKC
uniref:Putative secreted protein n=1 Tax=Amblyomma cajennense TaxID=34607 RepID=A0A023FB85_AMBCJ